MPAVAPEWAQRPPEPLAYARAGWARLSDGVNDGKDRAQLAVVLLGAWYVLTMRPWVPILLVVGAWLAAVMYGLGTVWLCQTGSAPWKWTTRGAIITTAGTFLLGVWWFATGALFAALLLSVAAAQGFAYRPHGEKDPNWWGEERLLLALRAAGIVKADPIPWLRRAGRPSITAAAQSITVVVVTGPKLGVPLGITAEAVRPAQKRLEAVMGLKAGQLHVHHDDDQEAAALTFTVTPPPRRDVVTANLPDRWDYNDALPIGKDRMGRDVTRRTWGCHAGFVGMTGSGKTWFGRYEIAHALLDPAVRVFLIDGKGDDHDWTAMHPLCERVVVGSNLTAGRQALTVLEDIEALSESRKGTPDAPGIVVVIDEWYRLLLEVKRKDPKLAADLDGLLTGLHATARSRRIRFLTFWQAGTKDYISKAMRVNMGQRFCGQTESTAEVRYFLEQIPEHLPTASGQFIVKDEGQPPVLVTVPALNRDAFEVVCARAARLRSGAVEAPTDPLIVAVHRLLAIESLKASQILTLLPEDVRPRTAQALGYALRKMPGVEPTTVGPKADKAWKLSENLSVHLSAVPAEAPGPRGSEAESSVPETQAEDMRSVP